MSTGRKRGRPRLLEGPSRQTFPHVYGTHIRPVLEFVSLWRALLRERGRDRYQDALSITAPKFNMSRRTLERRYVYWKSRLDLDSWLRHYERSDKESVRRAKIERARVMAAELRELRHPK